jgi:hypothetical protein
LDGDLTAGPDGRPSLRVHVCDPGMIGTDLPDVAGDLQWTQDEALFVPRFPFAPGVFFCASLDLDSHGRLDGDGVINHRFALHRESESVSPAVTAIYPSAEVLPENLLRLYVRFATPMRRGHAQSHIDVMGIDGQPVSDVLYRAPVELWDRSMMCLTVLFDPGRLKRGVGPNRALGPPLQVGQSYTLRLKRGWLDATGRPLPEDVHKTFKVAPARRDAVVIANWTLKPAFAGTRDPLEVTFPYPLDWAELFNGIGVISPSGDKVRGHIRVDGTETRWRFVPEQAWPPGNYSLRVDAALEDPCGNATYGAFDGPLRSVEAFAEEKGARLRPFSVDTLP